MKPDGVYLDCTAGLGSHTALIAARLTTGLVIANDRDAESLKMAETRLAGFGERVRTQLGRFSELPETLRAQGIERVDGLLADLGASRYQLTDAERGLFVDGGRSGRYAHGSQPGNDGRGADQFSKRKRACRPDFSARRRREVAEDSQSNRQGAADSHDATACECGGAGRAPDGSPASGNADLHGIENWRSTKSNRNWTHYSNTLLGWSSRAAGS